jgi:Flp pilus assembly protein TadD
MPADFRAQANPTPAQPPNPYSARRRPPARPRSSPSPWRRTSPYGRGIPPDVREALAWLGRHWLTLVVLVVVSVRAILRFRERRETSSAGEMGAGLSLGVSEVAPRASRDDGGGEDPLARIAELRHKLQARAADGSLRIELAELLCDSGRNREAVVLLRESLGLSPADATFHLKLGEALANACAWDEALAEIDTAILIEPTLAEAHQARGGVLAEKHWVPSGEVAAPAIAAWKEAWRLYERRLVADPGNAVLRARLGSLLLDAGDSDDGLAHLQRAATESPDDADVQGRLAAALEALGRHEEAQGQYRVAAAAQRRVAEANPRHAGHQARLGDLLNEAGEDGDVDAWFDAALIDPDYGRDLGGVEEILVGQAGEGVQGFFAAARHLRAGRWQEAASGFSEFIAEQPICAHALCGLGEALLQLRKTSEARRALARALDLRPGWARPAGLLRQLARS